LNSIKSVTLSLAHTISSFTSSVYKKAKSLLSRSLSWFSGLWGSGKSGKSSKESKDGKKEQVEVKVSSKLFRMTLMD